MPEPALAAGTRYVLKTLGITVPEGERVCSCRVIPKEDGEDIRMETDNYVYMVSEDYLTVVVHRKNMVEKRGDGAT